MLLRERSDGTIEGEVQGGCDVDDVRAQVARILSLDHDGAAWLAVGEADPVIGRLQREHPGRAAGPVSLALRGGRVVDRVRAAARAARPRRCAGGCPQELGATFDVGGVAMAAFPLPERLLEVTPGPGLPEEKVVRLRGVAEAALAGRLDPERLRALDPAGGAGRAAGAARHRPVLRRADPHPRVRRRRRRDRRAAACLETAARAYGLDGPPDAGAFLAAQRALAAVSHLGDGAAARRRRRRRPPLTPPRTAGAGARSRYALAAATCVRPGSATEPSPATYPARRASIASRRSSRWAGVSALSPSRQPRRGRAARPTRRRGPRRPDEVELLDDDVREAGVLEQLADPGRVAEREHVRLVGSGGGRAPVPASSSCATEPTGCRRGPPMRRARCGRRDAARGGLRSGPPRGRRAACRPSAR